MVSAFWDAIEMNNDTRFGTGKWHCDDLANVRDVPECVKAFLDVARAPAIEQLKMKRPPLFATHEGQRVRVVMASRFGDVGITGNLNAEYGYSKRVYLPMLTDFSDEADNDVT